jgi:hypothetical protein
MASDERDVELIPPGQALEKNSVHTHPVRPRYAKASRWWLVWEQARLEQLERVVRAEQGGIDAMTDHALAQGRFQSVPTDIALMKLKKENDLDDEKRKAKLQSLSDDKARLKLEVEIAEYQKRLSELNGVPSARTSQEVKLPPMAEKLLNRKREHKAVVVALKEAHRKGELTDEELNEALAETEHYYGRDSSVQDE